MSEANKFSVTLTVDARNLLCPMPILRTDAAINKLEIGQIMEVQATDPGLINDLPAWCAVNGHEMLEMKKQGRLVTGWLKKG